MSREFYNRFKGEILETMRKLARQAKKKEDLCAELDRLRKLIAAVGGKQLPPEYREELRALIEEAKRVGGCK